MATKVCLVKAMVFPMVRYGCESWTIKKAELWIVIWVKFTHSSPFGHDWETLLSLWKNCCFWTVVLEKTLESPLDCKEIKRVHSKWDQSWMFLTLATWCEELIHWKRPWCWERLRAGGEGDDRGWDGWTASPTQRTCVWTNSGSYWRTEKPEVCSPWGCKELDMT